MCCIVYVHSFGLNHYGSSYTTGRRCPPDAAPIALAFGATERVFEKDGKVIGVKGENGHPYTGKSRWSSYILYR